MNELKMCPCGMVPSQIDIFAGQGSKWAYAAGNCCNEWHIEFRTQYHDLESDECMRLAINAWNNTPRIEGYS